MNEIEDSLIYPSFQDFVGSHASESRLLGFDFMNLFGTNIYDSVVPPGG